jgi:hypothetical protein
MFGKFIDFDQRASQTQTHPLAALASSQTVPGNLPLDSRRIRYPLSTVVGEAQGRILRWNSPGVIGFSRQKSENEPDVN